MLNKILSILFVLNFGNTLFAADGSGAGSGAAQKRSAADDGDRAGKASRLDESARDGVEKDTLIRFKVDTFGDEVFEIMDSILPKAGVLDCLLEGLDDESSVPLLIPGISAGVFRKTLRLLGSEGIAEIGVEDNEWIKINNLLHSLAVTEEDLSRVAVENSFKWMFTLSPAEFLAVARGHDFNFLKREKIPNFVIDKLDGYAAVINASASASCLDFSLDDSKLLVSTRVADSVNLYDLVADTVANFGGEEKAIYAKFDSTGEKFAICADNNIRILNATTGAVVHNLVGHEDIVRSVNFSHDGQLLVTASDDCTVCIWRVADGALLHTLGEAQEADDPEPEHGHTYLVSGAVFNHNSTKVATYSFEEDQTVRIWDVATGAELHVIEIDSDIQSVQFTSDDTKIMVADEEGLIRFWNVVSGEELEGTCIDVDKNINFALLNSDNDRVIVLAGNGDIDLYGVTRKKQLSYFGNSGSPGSYFCFSHSGRYIAFGYEDGRVLIKDLNIYNSRGVDKIILAYMYQQYVANGDSVLEPLDPNLIELCGLLASEFKRLLVNKGVVNFADMVLA